MVRISVLADALKTMYNAERRGKRWAEQAELISCITGRDRSEAAIGARTKLWGHKSSATWRLLSPAGGI